MATFHHRIGQVHISVIKNQLDRFVIVCIVGHPLNKGEDFLGRDEYRLGLVLLVVGAILNGQRLGVVEEGLTLLNKLVPDQALKIAKEIKSLRDRWDNEISKGNNMDDAMLDSIELELRDLCQVYAAAVKHANASDKLK